MLRTIGAGAAIVGLGGARVLCAQDATSALSATTLRDGLIQIGGAGGNVVVLRGADGLLMVDSGAAEHAQQLTAFVAQQFASAPVRVLFNTHWHLEHTGGNDALCRSVTIVAHENTRLWMSTEFYVDWQNPVRAARAARSEQTFFSTRSLEIEFGGPRSRTASAGAHTDGDIYVRFPEHNVIVAGGAVTAGEYPSSTTSRAAGSAGWSTRRRSSSR